MRGSRRLRAGPTPRCVILRLNPTRQVAAIYDFVMLIIFGLRSYVKTLAVLTLACRQGHVAAHRVVKVTRKFTLFFIPLFPVRHRYYSVCTLCGLQLPWDKESAEAAARQAAAAAPAMAPPPVDPVAPPLNTMSFFDSSDGRPPAALDPPRAAPGWYPDPAGGGYRYWDGAAWTESVHEGGGGA
jgi:hypothetical protein